jgi:hypothetical protein
MATSGGKPFKINMDLQKGIHFLRKVLVVESRNSLRDFNFGGKNGPACTSWVNRTNMGSHCNYSNDGLPMDLRKRERDVRPRFSGWLISLGFAESKSSGETGTT